MGVNSSNEWKSYIGASGYFDLIPLLFALGGRFV
jgi:hypothetical protein